MHAIPLHFRVVGVTGKKFGKSDIIGAKGVALIQHIVLNMDFFFYPTGSVESGIDGYVELRETTGRREDTKY